jgi:hypothetical protein
LRGTAPFVPATPAQLDTPGKEERLKRGKGAFLQETPTSLSPSPRKEIPLFPRVTAACWRVVRRLVGTRQRSVTGDGPPAELVRYSTSC